MEPRELPIGFTMALAMNEPAMKAYASMTESQKQDVVSKAQNAHSKEEMHSIVNNIVK